MKKILLGRLIAFTAGAWAQDRRPDYGPAGDVAAAKKIAAVSSASAREIAGTSL